MRILELMYRSPLGYLMSYFAKGLYILNKPIMIYGFRDPNTKKFRKYTRISSSTALVNKHRLSIEDKVWIWNYSILDATEGLEIGRGCQIGAWVGIFTHGSEKAIRLLGEDFINTHHSQRKGYTRGTVKIGPYCFIAAKSIIMPGVTIGKGCLIGASTLVNKDVPDYSIVVGQPGKVVGSTLEFDSKLFEKNDFSETYYDTTALKLIKEILEKNHGK